MIIIAEIYGCKAMYYRRLEEANKMRGYWGERKFRFHQKTLADRFTQERKNEKMQDTEDVTPDQK